MRTMPMQLPAKLALFLCSAMLAASALAQYPGGGTPRGGLLGRPATGETAHPQGNPEDQLEFRMYQLHTDLKLTPVQEVAWGAFADKIKALVADIARDHDRAFASGTLDSMKQIDQTANIMRNRLTAIEDIANVAHLLYDRLTPEQKVAADPRLATIVQTAIRVDNTAKDTTIPDLSVEPALATPSKPGKIRFGPPPAPDPSRRDTDVGR
jgi:LTXXQ motif family protein